MKKLLIFHPYLAPYRIDLYNRLAKLFDVQVLLSGSEAEKNTLGFDVEFVNRQAQFKFSYVQKGFYVGRHLLSSVFFKQIRSFRPDVVMAHELGINTLAAIFLKPFLRYKLLVTVDDSPGMIRSYGKIRRLLQQFVIKHTDALLLVHPEVRIYLENKYNAKYQCRFNYFPIIQDDERLKEKFLLAKGETLQLLLRHNLENKKVILFVGRLESVKCPDMLLRAFRQLNDENCLLVFVGKGSLDEELKYYVKKNHLDTKVIFTGILSGFSLYAWYLLADVFVLPSQFEPFGAVVNEALVAGCEVVVSDKVGANSLIEASNGIIFKSNDEQELVTALNRVVRAGLNYPKGNWRPSKMVISFEDIFFPLVDFIEEEDED
jgi:glycosyltransferase involved in cell wall biosynthesis